MKVKDIEVAGYHNELHQYFVVKDMKENTYCSRMSWGGIEYTHKIEEAERFETYDDALETAIMNELKQIVIMKFYLVEEKEDE
jgi:hypothetical protein